MWLLGKWNMAGNALGTTFSLLLLLASVIQGEQNGEVIHYETMEAAVGQNITLPCIVKKHTDLKIVSIEWSKKKKEKDNENIKLAVYSISHGHYYFWPNVTVLTEKNNANTLTGTRLHLPSMTKWDSGIYVCDITTFPLGSIRAETQLAIRDDDIEINCNVNSTVKVHDGENVTIHCRLFPNTWYRWTKDKEQVSESESLELWRVTDANAGVYTLTVNTGNKSLHKDFIIAVLTATTSLPTDGVTVSPESLTKSAGSRFITSPTSGSLTHVDRTMNSTNDPKTSNVTLTSAGLITPSTNATHTNVSPSTATHSDRYHPLNSTPSSYGSTVFKAAQEMASDDKRNESKLYTLQPEDNSSLKPEEPSTPGSISQSPTLTVGTTVNVTEDKDTKRSHMLLVSIVLVLVLIAVAGCFYRRHLIKKRMDLPPSFKPPPPPVKYTAARHNEVYTGPYPIARCNSDAEFMRYETIV
ncbi:T-cell surface protein tactile [Parambassis ranga]|uniref:T-cell surface protein tactile n=1 Tax=Parambassis ranga TaxID=210632 RepID=A0A6P7JJP1_9TELE|nr:T-cell surface protein tactile-like [Parambassis ranga]